MGKAIDILLATGNPHKVEELQAIFEQEQLSGIRLLSLKDVTKTHEPAETGSTFEQNATIKALSYTHQTGLPALADDSGLEIDALDGKPGVISSHYCTDGKETGMTRTERDAANNARVLKEMQGITNRAARFVCVMALAHQGKVIASARGTFEGAIGIPPRVPSGIDGFGYDPLFLVAPSLVQTSSELSPTEKNQLSHRGKAARIIANALRTFAATQR
ncbi:MAG: RdgB/HAM1 family non-canonical purine NTP pyrophosphatase [Phycisphaerales bacterium]